MDIGDLHVLLVHFPIALGLSAALADVIWSIRRRDFFRHAGFYCLILAALAAIPTVITGDAHLEDHHFEPPLADIAETHEDLGISTLCVLLAAAALRSVRRNRLAGWWLAPYAALVAAVAVLVSITAHYGGKLAFGPDYLSKLF